jgi:lysophospholipase L1-like esterase
VLLSSVFGSRSAVAESFPLEAKRILFLGDSITHAGLYVTAIETQLRLQGVDPLPEIINIGLSSETCSGLSEPDHPFPRPDVHERLDRALVAVKPDVVVACYGMNDGIYHPFGAERFEAYQQGVRKLIAKVHAAGAKIIVLTPPPFDPVPLKDTGKLLPAGQDKYAYFAMYENYNDVLKRYGQWIMQEVGPAEDAADGAQRAQMVIDVHQPTMDYLAEQRKQNPEFTVARDGIHPDMNGHRVIAETVLKAWGVESWTEPSDELWKLMVNRGRILHDAWLSHVGHKRPGVSDGMPLPEARVKATEIIEKVDALIQEARTAQSGSYPSTGGVVHHIHYPATAGEGELRLHVDYELWVPEGVDTIRGIIVHQHGCGPGASIGGRTAADDLHWQALAAKWNCALMGSSYEPRRGVNCRLWCDARNGSETRFLQALDHFADATGHAEISQVPWCLWGHSGGAFWASLMQTMHPERIVAIWLRSGTAYGYWMQGEIPAPTVTDGAYRVPVMCNPGAKEKDDKRFHVAFDGGLAMFQAYRKQGAPIGFAPDPNTAHECGDSRYLAIPFFDACLGMRLPAEGSSSQQLNEVNFDTAWLAEPLTDSAVAADAYQGDAHQAVWLPNAAVAAAWSEYVVHGATSDQTAPPAPSNLTLTNNADGQTVLTWNAKADFESGLQQFIVLRDSQEFARVPQQPENRFGRPLFQGMSYHDTPVEPLRSMTLTVAADDVAGHEFQVVAVNSAGLKSDPGSPAKADR